LEGERCSISSTTSRVREVIVEWTMQSPLFDLHLQLSSSS